MCGVLFMAMPLAILGANFEKLWAERARLLLIERMQSHLLCAAGGDTHGAPRLLPPSPFASHGPRSFALGAAAVSRPW